MAIDPKKLRQQRKLVGAEVAAETKCACGARTRDKTGKCRACRIELPNLQVMRLDTLIRLSHACAGEIKRRQDEMTRALKAVAA